MHLVARHLVVDHHEAEVDVEPWECDLRVRLMINIAAQNARRRFARIEGIVTPDGAREARLALDAWQQLVDELDVGAGGLHELMILTLIVIKDPGARHQG